MKRETEKKAKNDGGLMSRAITKQELKSLSVSAWTQRYHKPYQCDWNEAYNEALQRTWDIKEDTSEQEQDTEDDA